MEEVSWAEISFGMRISHTQLESCRKNPAAWVAKGGAGRATFGYNAAVKLAIFHFHKTGSHKAAQDTLEGYLKNFVDAEKKQWARNTLDNYIVWFGKSDWLVADTKPRVSLDLGQEVSMSGEMSRIDIHPQTGHYQAVLLVPEIDGGWNKELRWPLVQLAISEKYLREVGEVSVGIQTLDGSEIETRCFSAGRIGKHVSEAAELAETISALRAKA